MLNYLFVALTWLVGIFGIAGAIAFAVAVVWLGPTALLTIVEPLLAKFFTCTKCVVLAAAVLATIAAYWIGRHEAHSECVAQAARSRIAAQHADASAAKKAADSESETVRRIEETAKAQHEADLAEIERLKNLPVPDACVFGDDDIGVRDSAGASRKGATATAKPSDKAATGPAPKQGLWLSLVRHLGMQRKGRAGDAASHN